MKKIFWGLLVSLTSLATLAGHDVGNGGDAVVCKDASGNITSVRLLDYYEAVDLGGLKLDFENIETVRLKVMTLINRLEVTVPVKDNLNKKLVDFYKNAVFAPGIELEDTDDSDHIARPKNCVIEQIAVQVDTQYPYQKRYTISKDLWDHMDDNHRAGLIFHELIYGLNLNAPNSIAVRALNGIAASSVIGAVSDAEAFQLYSAVKLPSLLRIGLDFDPRGKYEIYENGKIKSAYVNNEVLTIGTGRIQLEKDGHQIGFNEQGQISTIMGEVLATTTLVDTTNQTFICSQGWFMMEDGVVYSCNQTGGPVHYKFGKSEFKCSGNNSIIHVRKNENEKASRLVCKLVQSSSANQFQYEKSSKNDWIYFDLMGFEQARVRLNDFDFCLPTGGKEKSLSGEFDFGGKTGFKMTFSYSKILSHSTCDSKHKDVDFLLDGAAKIDISSHTNGNNLSSVAKENTWITLRFGPFWDNTPRLARFVAGEELHLRHRNGALITVKEGQSVNLDENRMVISVDN